MNPKHSRRGRTEEQKDTSHIDNKQHSDRHDPIISVMTLSSPLNRLNTLLKTLKLSDCVKRKIPLCVNYKRHTSRLNIQPG